MADRGIPLTHTTILRWVQHYLPEFEKRWSRYARPVGASWRMDETYEPACSKTVAAGECNTRAHCSRPFKAIEFAWVEVDHLAHRKT